MSLDNRNTSAQFKRAEQLKRWEESEMNKKLSGSPKSPSTRRIKFSSGCIFLAACVAGDKEEVEWLLKNGADIDTANVDGLTALHQACIDDNLDMVEFLVQKGADVNRKDNEGWTPLHATASCGFLSIARYLIENGADLAAINTDGELAVDLASSDAMEDLIQHHLDEQGIDCEEARGAEERIMLSDAKKWLRTDSTDCDKAHPKTGATAIHVAAAKGYISVLKLLLEGRGDIDRQDVDGWTPLHAAAYWGQKEATQLLLNASVDIDIQNYSGQLAIDIAHEDIVPLLKEARKNVKRTKRRPPSHGNRITDNFENNTETPTKVIRVEVKPIDNNKEKEEVSEKENQPTEPDVILRRTQSFENDEKKTTSNLVLGSTTSPSAAAPTGPTSTLLPTAGGTGNTGSAATASPPTSPSGTPATTPTAGQIRSTTNNIIPHSNTETQSNNTAVFGDRFRRQRYDDRLEEQIPEAATRKSLPPAPNSSSAVSSSLTTDHRASPQLGGGPDGTCAIDHTPLEVTFTINNNNNNSNSATGGGPGGKNHSLFELNRKYIEQAQKTKINNERNKFLSSLNEKRQQQQPSDPKRDGTRTGKTEAPSQEASVAEPAEVKLTIPSTSATAVATNASAASPGTPSTNKLSPGNIFKNFFKSFVPPTRDEESETQRKAHAKRVRETRRSTQGVTLDEIKSAEQLVKKKNNVTGGGESDSSATSTSVAPATNTSSSYSSSASLSSSLSSTTAPVATLQNTTTSSAVNDRVPSVGDAQSNNEQQQQQQQSGNHVPCTVSSSLGGANSGSEKETTRDDAAADVVVSASFTLAAPASSSASGIASDIEREGGGGDDGGGGRRRRRSIPEVQEEDDSKVTVSYTISAPVRHASPSSRTGVGAPKETQDALSDVAAVSATFHVPQPPTASTRIRSISSTEVPSATPWSAGQERPASVGGNISASATIRTPAVTAGVVSNSDSSISTSAPSSANNTNNTVTTTTPATSSGGGHHNTTTTNSSSSYTKRSLFDIDNANSLTLAEKLRHEANKYAITASADGELDSSGHVLSSSRVPNSHQNAPTNSGVAGGGGGGSSEASETASAPADNSASASATVPPSPTLRKADPTATTAGGATAERRPSWRLKVDGGSKFKLEDASTPNAAIQSTSVVGGASYESSSAANEAPEHGSTTNTTTKLTASSALAQRRQQNGDSAAVAAAAGSRPGLAAGEQYNRVPGSTSVSATSAAAEAAAGTGDSSLLNLRRPPKSSTGSGGSSGPGGEENKENDKENDSRTAQATQAVIQRRRRQKRRSTGVVPLGMEDLDPDRQDSPVDGEEKETGSERGRSRVGSTASELDTASSQQQQQQDSSRENGGDFIDYKALYEQEKADNEKLKMALRKKDEEVVTLKAALDRFTTATTKNNSLSELEKRERRAMERKMSEMEEELKLLQKYKTENERLRAENRALTRVVSKLTTSAQNQIHSNAAKQ